MKLGLKTTGLTVLIVLAVMSPAFSAVLGAAKSCDVLRAQRNALEVLGVKQNMAHGPSWAKKNLPNTEIYLIRHYISIDERVRFLCRDNQNDPKWKVRPKKKRQAKKKKKRVKKVVKRN